MDSLSIDMQVHDIQQQNYKFYNIIGNILTKEILIFL